MTRVKFRGGPVDGDADEAVDQLPAKILVPVLTVEESSGFRFYSVTHGHATFRSVYHLTAVEGGPHGRVAEYSHETLVGAAQK